MRGLLKYNDCGGRGGGLPHSVTADAGHFLPVRLKKANVAFFVMLFYFWEGLPAVLLGSIPSSSKYVVSAFILFSCGVYVFQVARGAIRVSRWEAMAMLMFAYMVFVTVVYSGFVAPLPLSEWLFSIYQLTPVLLIVALRPYRFAAADAVNALVIVGVSASVIVIVDALIKFPFMEVYQREATTDATLRRIVFLKMETAFALSVVAVRWLTASNIRAKVRWSLFAIPPAISLFVFSESRSAIAAVLLGLTVFVLFIQGGTRRLKSILIGSAAMFVISPFFLAKYIEQFLGASDYFSNDQSNSFRLLELAHFYDYFLDTNGFGFGSMSMGEGKQNIIAWSSHEAGYLNGTWGYGLQLSDLGMYGALFQFGVVGLILTAYMTFKCLSRLIKIAKVSRYANEAGVLGATMLFFEINPWPVSYFTLDWSIFIGGVLWFVAGRLSHELRFGRRASHLRN